MMRNRQGNLLFAAILLIIGLATSCSAVVDVDSSEPKSPVLLIPSLVDITPTETAHPTQPSVPTSVDLPAQGSCSEEKGTIQRVSFRSSKLAGIQEYSIYLPACYDATDRLPVLYLLHGLTYTDDQWIRLGIASSADRLIEAGEIEPVIIVMPYNPGPSLPPTNRFGEVFIKELVPLVEKDYATCVDQNCRMIGGISRGGGWAYDIFVHNPGMFGKIGGHSPAMFKHDPRYFVWWISKDYRDEQLWVDIGDKDPETAFLVDVQKRLADENITLTLNIWSGEHNEEYWQAHLDEYLRWYMQE